MKKPIFSSFELRLIGISLALLSLGIAIAWLGYFWMMNKGS